MPLSTSPTVNCACRVGAGFLLGGGAVLTLGWLRSATERLPAAVGRSPGRQQAEPAGDQARDRALVEAQRARREAVEADERAGVAREIQDLVTHGLAAITVQTAAARRLLRSEPDTADQILAAVEQVGREAAEEMRTLLAVLRPGEAPARRPQPDLSQLGTLVESARADGLQVELAMSGTPRPVEPGIALTAYRVVEEALTTARGQADCCRVRVNVAWRGDLLELAVEEDGPAVPRRSTPSGPRDRLLGERVRAYGGRLHTSPPGGGFAVRATFPTRRSAA